MRGTHESTVIFSDNQLDIGQLDFFLKTQNETYHYVQWSKINSIRIVYNWITSLKKIGNLWY